MAVFYEAINNFPKTLYFYVILIETLTKELDI